MDVFIKVFSLFLGVLVADTVVSAPVQTVDHCVGKAAQWLLQNGGAQPYPGHALGQRSLVGLALSAAGEQQNRLVLVAAEQVRAAVAADSNTYDVALAILFLDSLGKARDRATLKASGERLAAGQLKNGAWSYGIPGTKSGGADYRNILSGGDNSCTQFAAIAGWVARRYGVRNDASHELMNNYFRGSVDPSTGGWGYSAGIRGGVSPSMTCAGLLGLAAAKGLAAKEEKKAVEDPIVQKAFGYLGEQLRQDPSLANDHYFLWSLERVAVIYNARTIGGVDWYEWGARHLLETQQQDGSWTATYTPAIDTSFAVLFLTRANVAEDLTEGLQGSGDPAISSGGGGGNQLLRRIKRVPEETAKPEG